LDGGADTWPDLKIQVGPSLVRIEPGEYEARSADLTSFKAFRRRILRLDFDVFRGPASDGILVARLPYFMPVPERRLSQASKLFRLFLLLGVQPARSGRLPLNLLRAKLWRVEVGDAEKDAAGAPLPPPLRYSVVKRVTERLA
jgi:hypothetical protein